MRELKFRVWNKDSNDWLHDCMLKETVFGCTSGYKWNSVGGFAELHPSRDHPEYTIEQYTGLKDRHGKEIYEGDIVDDGEGHIGKVLYNERIASFAYEWGNCGSTFMGLYTSDMKVIGNIHENHELLEEEE